MKRLKHYQMRGYLVTTVKAILREPILQRLRGFKQLIYGNPLSVEVPEIIKLNKCRSSIQGTRINLLIPSINKNSIYGGTYTALLFFQELVDYFDFARIISLDYVPKKPSAFIDYQIVYAGEDHQFRNQIISIRNSYKHRLSMPIGPQDFFIATSWPTAHLAQQLIQWQSQAFNQAPKHKIYFIQDYEPCFYSWSSQYALARATYESSDPTIAVFNTSLLKNYFRLQNHSFTNEFSFEPRISEELRDIYKKARLKQKRKQILIYGRPSIPRNAFSLIIEALNFWQTIYEESATWEVLSVGEHHSDIRLSNDLTIKSLGKLSLVDYANILADSAIGISLMISPHPSYPPLEMAHFGLKVLTNGFFNKDLSKLHENIISIDLISSEKIASELKEICKLVEQNLYLGWEGKSFIHDYMSNKSPFEFVDNIIDILISQK